MGEIVLKNTFQLRRDTAINWTNANPTLRAGEPGFEIDTGKLKIGDGSTEWILLNYLTDTTSLVWGYYLNDKFYTDSTYQTEIVGSNTQIYVALNDSLYGDVYTFDGTHFIQSTKTATELVAGTVKLYNELGTNIDGTITQACVTNVLNTKLSGHVENEELILTV